MRYEGHGTFSTDRCSESLPIVEYQRLGDTLLRTNVSEIRCYVLSSPRQSPALPEQPCIDGEQEQCADGGDHKVPANQ
jgi:hypothetical protein